MSFRFPVPPAPRTAARPRRFLPPALALLALLAFAAPPARAQSVRPWTPGWSDSLSIWGAEARAAFRANVGDSLGGSNLRAYEMVGRMGRRMVRSLGRDNMLQARAVEAVLDSMGLDTEVALDDRQPSFALLMVHNPYRPSAYSIGFIFWWKGEELRGQGIQFRGGHDPRIRVWWTGQSDLPYEMSIVDGVRGEPRARILTVLALAPNGNGWNALQFEGGSPPLPPASEATWADLDQDGRPELVVWGPAAADSLFESCSDCPKVMNETIYTLRGAMFEHWDSRLLPSPWATFSLFVRLLGDGNRAAAARLLRDPARLDEAVKLGWGATSGKAAWRIEYAEPGQSWPRWLAIRHLRGAGRPLYIVHFTQRDGRWVILEWKATSPAGAPPPPSPAPGGAKPGRP